MFWWRFVSSSLGKTSAIQGIVRLIKQYYSYSIWYCRSLWCWYIWYSQGLHAQIVKNLLYQHLGKILLVANYKERFSCFIKWLFVPLDNALFLFDKWLYQMHFNEKVLYLMVSCLGLGASMLDQIFLIHLITASFGDGGLGDSTVGSVLQQWVVSIGLYI